MLSSMQLWEMYMMMAYDKEAIYKTVLIVWTYIAIWNTAIANHTKKSCYESELTGISRNKFPIENN